MEKTSKIYGIGLICLATAILSFGIISPMRMFWGSRYASSAGIFLFAMLSWSILLKMGGSMKAKTIIVTLMISALVFGTLPAYYDADFWWKDCMVTSSLYFPFRLIGILVGYLLWKSNKWITIVILSILWIVCAWVSMYGYQEFFYLVMPDAPRITYTPHIVGME